MPTTTSTTTTVASASKMSIEDVPIDVVEKIFCTLLRTDPALYFRLGQVSKTFRRCCRSTSVLRLLIPLFWPYQNDRDEEDSGEVDYVNIFDRRLAADRMMMSNLFRLHAAGAKASFEEAMDGSEQGVTVPFLQRAVQLHKDDTSKSMYMRGAARDLLLQHYCYSSIHTAMEWGEQIRYGIEVEENAADMIWRCEDAALRISYWSDFQADNVYAEEICRLAGKLLFRHQHALGGEYETEEEAISAVRADEYRRISNKQGRSLTTPLRKGELPDFHSIVSDVVDLVFVEEGYKVNDDFYETANSFLDVVTRTKKGIPLSLSFIVCGVARRLGLLFYPVLLPGEVFTMAVSPNGKEEFLIRSMGGGEVMDRASVAKARLDVGMRVDDQDFVIPSSVHVRNALFLINTNWLVIFTKAPPLVACFHVHLCPFTLCFTCFSFLKSLFSCRLRRECCRTYGRWACVDMITNT
mmetsp:Transcript_43414/g.112964  ORF Transcript_43414/g.112964 Transcript_43414/m.112964 type:complete len:466 (-) Transcript_43414:1017-2414(-)